MCWMCEENNGEYEYCQDCGVPICFDTDPSSEYPALAGVTESGDLFCAYHARQREQAEQELYDEDDWTWASVDPLDEDLE